MNSNNELPLFHPYFLVKFHPDPDPRLENGVGRAKELLESGPPLIIAAPGLEKMGHLVVEI